MRSRLVFVLGLALVGAVGLSVLAMGGVTAWQLRSGFTAYLQQRDLERLDVFAQVVSQVVEREGGMEALRERRLTMRQLMFELGQREGVFNASTPPPSEKPPPLQAPPGIEKGKPPPPAPETFAARVALFEADGRPLFPHPLVEGKEATVERIVNVFGKPAIIIKLVPIPRLPAGEEATFLNNQYRSIVTVACLLLLSALALATVLGRKWTKALTQVKEATAKIAEGDFTTRLTETSKNEIGDVMRNINLMADSLARMEGDRRRWIADISHELRTPLLILGGEVDAMIENVRPLTKDNLRSLQDEVQNLSKMVNDLHLLSMADLQALPCYFAEEDAIELVQSVVHRLTPRSNEAGLTLTLHSTALTKLPVYWDSKRIQQVLVNLLENSIRYTDAPGNIFVRLYESKGRVHIEVSDSAPSIPTADLPKIFSPLYRADAARTRAKGGSGLGLAICQAIVTSHGGKVKAAQSNLGGVTVLVSIPIEANAKTHPSASK
jgi:two-component system, OmpR family, sensor histidine kinase BaeS